MHIYILLSSIYNSPHLALIIFILGPVLAAVTLVLGLASFGASFGLRKMYVKALLKIFEVLQLLKNYFIYFFWDLIRKKDMVIKQTKNRLKIILIYLDSESFIML